MPEARSILVIAVSRIGDTMLVTPALRAIAAAWPAARLEFLGHPKRAEILLHLPFLRRVGTISKQSAPLRGWWPGRSYDLAFVYGEDRALIEYALRIARRVAAFRQRDESLNRRLYRIAEPLAFQSAHAVRVQLALPAALGAGEAGHFLSYCVTERERRWAHDQLHAHGISGPGPLIGLQVASFPTKAYRDWPLEAFVEICHRVRARYAQAHFLLFGGTAERERTRRLHAEFAGSATHLAGELSLRQTAALMEQTDLYLGVDTGPTHIMGALRRPMVALYHPYSPSWLLGPLDHPCAYLVDHPRAGSGCGPETPIAEITVDRVWTQVALALERHFAGGTR